MNATFVQPFVNYTFPNTVGITLNTEATYDWEAEQWTVPINAQISRIFKFGAQPVSLAAAGRYYVERPSGGPEWGVRFTATLLFPKSNSLRVGPSAKGRHGCAALMGE